MQCTSEFMADSCSVSQNPMKKEAGAGGEQKHKILFPETESQAQQKPRKLP